MVQVSRLVMAQSALMAALISIDQFSKWVAVSQQSSVLLNYGVSFGWWSIATAWQILLIGLLLITLTIFWRQQQSWYIALILAGGWSNWFDRVSSGAVIDWMLIPGTNITNNLADYWIAIGVVGLISSTIIHAWKKKGISV